MAGALEWKALSSEQLNKIKEDRWVVLDKFHELLNQTPFFSASEKTKMITNFTNKISQLIEDEIYLQQHELNKK